MTAPEFCVRPATDADLPWIMALEGRADMLAFIGGSTLEEHRAWLADPDFRHFVAETGGAPVGFAIMQGYIATPTALFLRRLAVSVAGGGIGSRLLRWLTDTAFADGVPRFRLNVFEENHRARDIYARYGFVLDPEYEVKVMTRRDGVEDRSLPLVLFNPAAHRGEA